jgi:hypothetical protein
VSCAKFIPKRYLSCADTFELDLFVCQVHRRRSVNPRCGQPHVQLMDKSSGASLIVAVSAAHSQGTYTFRALNWQALRVSLHWLLFILAFSYFVLGHLATILKKSHTLTMIRSVSRFCNRGCKPAKSEV